MSNFIQRFLDIFFKKEELLEEYERVLKKINNAEHLGELFNARVDMLKFYEQVKERNSPQYLMDRVKILLTRWDHKYRIWKIQSR